MVEVQTEVIKGRIFVAQIVEDDIFHLNYFPDEFAIDSDFKEGHEAYNSIRNGRKMKIIIENGKYTVIDTSAREYLQNNKFEAIAAAVVMHSIGQRIIYNFYIKFRKQDHPIRAFKNFILAKEWLKKF